MIGSGSSRTRKRILAPRQRDAYAALIARRLRGEPLAYLIGEKEFYSNTFRVNRHTLIPRPETELVVERVLAITESDQPFQLLDLGTGCGAIAVSVALERPAAMVVATDISAAAIDVARDNAHQLKARNVEFRCGSWFTPIPGQRFDLVVSNPPYVESDFASRAPPEITYEPPGALYAGRDGLDAVQNIAAGAGDSLYAGGRLLIEHGPGQARAVATILNAHGLVTDACHKDLAGRGPADRSPFTQLKTESPWLP